jgi:ribosomal protein L16/L10AE
MSSRQIFRLKVFLKKAVRKPDITKRLVWFNTFPHLPLTKKPKGMRMGKGAGKLNAWQIQMCGGVFVLEFKNLRPGRAVHFFKKVATKLPTNTTIHFNATRRMKMAGGCSSNPIVKSFWN